jgi:hypothetical protein
VDEEKGLTWTESDGHCHVRLDIDEGWRWMADFYAAFVKKNGSDAKIAHITMGEYFPGNSGVPPSVDLQLFKANVKKVWQQVIAAAPKDATGNRINIVQVNPITFGGDVTADDMAAIGIRASIGASDSDPYLFTNNGGRPDGSLCDRNSM